MVAAVLRAVVDFQLYCSGAYIIGPLNFKSYFI